MQRHRSLRASVQGPSYQSADPPSPAGYSGLPTTDVWDRAESQESAQFDNAHIAAGKAISYLMEADGFCGVERHSVYGAAVAIPQIARSVGWSTTMTGLAFRSYIILVFNIFLQLFLLSMLNEELELFNPISGRMHLCDFGASIQSCPDGANCRGPGGTTYDIKNLYSFSAWSVRVFTRDSLLKLFPERADDIVRIINPGEFGVEDYYCRLACCLIFVMQVYGDLQDTIRMWQLLYNVPSKPETWIRYELPVFADKVTAKKVKGWTELDLVKFTVAGMPLHWKAINFVMVLIPKAFIWWTLVTSGFHFLMETPEVIECLINCIALTFVLNIDETVFEHLATVTAKHMMNRLEDMPLFDMTMEEQETEAQAALRFQRNESNVWDHKLRLLHLVMPGRLICILLFVMCFVGEYYHSECIKGPDGGYISKNLYLPENMSYDPLAFLFSSFRKMSHTPIWVMPLVDPFEAVSRDAAGAVGGLPFSQ